MQKTKEVTIYDIADKLNLSPATVSRALKDEPIVNKKTKKRIFDMAEKIGYRTNNFARNLRNQKTDTIGVIIPKVNSYFMSAVIAGIEMVVKSEGYTLIISQSSEVEQNEAASAKAMFNNRVDGLLVSLAYDTKSLKHFEPFLKRNIPVVFFDRVIENNSSYSILIDNHNAAYEATKHLIEQGCRRIVHITATSDLDVYVHRLKGYKQALADNGISFAKDRVLKGNLSLEYGKQAAEVILKMKQRPDGIFVANDNCAVGCMMTLKENGIRIPEDIAIVGFNNDPVSEVIEPNLTTIEYPGSKMGEVAARQLINHLKNVMPADAVNKIELPSSLIVRASSSKKK